MPIEKLQVLVADDHYANQLLTQTLLQRDGHQVTLAKDGRQAVEVFTAKVFDLVLLDIQMPVLDGFGALNQIRELCDNKPLSRTAIFALTAYSYSHEVKKIMASGFDAVLVKPFRIEDLESRWNGLKTTTTPAAIPASMPESPFSLAGIQKLPLIDEAIFNTLKGATGPDAMKRILKVFWSDTHALLNTIIDEQRLLASTMGPYDPQNLDNLRKAAHGLKGASANIGLLRTSKTAAQLQNAPVETTGVLIVALRRALDESKALLDSDGLTNHAQPPRSLVM